VKRELIDRDLQPLVPEKESKTAKILPDGTVVVLDSGCNRKSNSKGRETLGVRKCIGHAETVKGCWERRSTDGVDQPNLPWEEKSQTSREE